MKIISLLKAFLFGIFCLRFFNSNSLFKNSRIAVIGAADSIFSNKNGEFIDSFNWVIRVNKALYKYDFQRKDFLGLKTDILLHNFFENTDTGGGGPIDWNLFKKFNLKFLIQPRFDKSGLHTVLNYFRKYNNYTNSIYLLPPFQYLKLKKMFSPLHPTKGFTAIYLALNSSAYEVFITGFTFFRTPYIDGYRENLKSVESNLNFINMQGLHSPELEYENFILLLIKTKVKNILVDEPLFNILINDSRLKNVIIRKIG